MTCDEVRALPPDHTVAFPDSSQATCWPAALGQPPDGWPADVDVLLRGEKPRPGRWGATLPPADFDAIAAELEGKIERKHDEVLSYVHLPAGLPGLRRQAPRLLRRGRVADPVFFYGMQIGEETPIDIEQGKRLIVKFLTIGEPHSDGTRTIFFELNGQPRQVNVRDRSAQRSTKGSAQGARRVEEATWARRHRA
ncbi:MAG: hypothetical protein R2748_00345 [Bryobacterales bacterium]